MGRLFQYNRFGSTDNTNKKDNLIRTNSKTKEIQPATKCPAYSELYPEFVVATTKAATATATLTTSSATATQTMTTTTATATTTTTTTTTTTSKSVELAIKKYQQWSSKFLTPTVLTTTTAASTSTSAANVSQSSVSAASASTTSSYSSCSTSSGYNSGRLGAENDRELLVRGGAVRRPKVYDCMKDFLRRKLFQQNAAVPAPKQNIVKELEEQEHEVTSDYDEIDMLDSSYNAEDEEEGSTDCSCSYSSSEDEGERPHVVQTGSSPQKSALSLNCWQHSNYTDSTTEAEEEEEQENDEDSDAGISDCCQLISDAPSCSKRKSPKTRTSPSRKQKNQRFNIHDDELPELLESTWYQPRITTKAALERLQQATTPPGSFLLRRKAHHFELCLRDATSKVKRYAVLATAQDTYKLKGAKKQFTSLRALVTHHSVMAEQLPVTLALKREQVSDKCVSLRCADDFDTFESLQILGILKSLQAKSFEFA